MNRIKRFGPLAGILVGVLAGGVACQNSSGTPAVSVPPAAEVQARLVYFAIPG